MASKIIKQENISEQIDIKDQFDLGVEAAPVISKDSSKVLSQTDLQEREEAQTVLQQAQKQAQKIKTHAKKLYERIETEMAKSKEQAYQEGLEQGKSEVTEQLVAFHKQHDEWAQGFEKQAIKLIYDIAERVIRNTLKESDDSLVAMIHQALDAAMGNELKIFVNPQDYERLKSEDNQVLESFDSLRSVTFKASDSVKEGGCLIESELGTMDAQLEIQLAGIKKALGIYSKQ